MQKPKSQSNDYTLETLENYRHRLMALRIELSDAFKTKQVSKAYTTRQSEKINECLEMVRTLQSTLSGGPKESLSWLQKFVLKNDDERQLAIQFSMKRISEAKKALIQIQKLSAACKKAKSNETSVFWRTYTLSGLLRRLKVLERAVEHIKSVGKRVESQIQSMVKTNNKAFVSTENIEEMIDLVNKVDEASRRVIEKKSQVRAKKQKLEQMKTWLEQQKQLIRSSALSHRPPDPLDIQTLKDHLHDTTLSTLEKTRSRLTTARRLQSVLEQSVTRNDPSVIQLTGKVEKNVTEEKKT